MTLRRDIKQYLKVYLQGSFVGNLCSDKGILSFSYAEDYLQKPEALKLSTSLPLQKEAFPHNVVSSFFSGLLPDEDVRRRLARYLGLSTENIFALLKEIGGECAGAISLYPEGMNPNFKGSTYRVLDEKEGDEILSSLDKRPLLAGEKGIRISGAGAQNKLMIAFVDGKIAIPTGTTASTHIIKPPIWGIEESVQNEYFCMRLAQKVNLPVPSVFIYWLNDKPYYLIERYDRRKDKNDTVKRLHQEDFCQALHFPPEMKYENEGGPTLEDCFSLLDEKIKSGFMSPKNKIMLLEGVIFNFLIGNGDAHGKNFSLLYEGESEILAPFYDLISTVVYSNHFKEKMAMKMSGTYKFKEVSMRHWERFGGSIGFTPDFIKQKVIERSNEVKKASQALYEELNRDPKIKSPIYEKIMKGIIQRTSFVDFQN